MGEKDYITLDICDYHTLVLSYIAQHKRITALEPASEVGITERATRKIIADLLQTGYITKKREGRQNCYKIVPELPLLHPVHGEVESWCPTKSTWLERETKEGRRLGSSSLF